MNNINGYREQTKTMYNDALYDKWQITKTSNNKIKLIIYMIILIIVVTIITITEAIKTVTKTVIIII